MIAPQAPPVAIPTFWQMLVTHFAQKGLTIAFTVLAAHGIFVAGERSEFMELGLAAALGLASVAWTWIATRISHSRTVALANAPAVEPPIPTKTT